MTEQAPAGKETNTDVIVGGKKTNPTTKRRKLLAVYVLVIFLLAVVSTTIFYAKAHKNDTPANASAHDSFNTLFDQVLQLGLNGQYNKAQDLIDASLAKAKTAEDKGNLYNYKSVVAYNAGDYQQALDYANTSEGLNRTASSAGDIATSAEAIGDKSLALKYYQAELQRSDDGGIQGGNDELKAKIKSLGG